METKQIMLVCAAGMSTSLMVSKMEKAAQDQGLDAHIFAERIFRWLVSPWHPSGSHPHDRLWHDERR